ncbi:MAG: OmpA family protein [Anaerolineaceae bacterium]|nr:OmpA family protein [Anaerolineaceae bacterium]
MAQTTQKPASKPDQKNKEASKPKQAYTPDRATQSSAPAQSDQAPPIGEMISRSINAFNQNLQEATGGNVVSSAPPVFRPEDMQSMQRLLGNRASSQVIQKWPWDDDEDEAEDESVTAETDEERTQREKQEFRDDGPYPAAATGTTVTPRTGVAGGFNARYDPASMALTILVNIGFNFVDGMTIAGNTVTAAEASMRSEATRINGVLAGLSAPQRAAAMATIQEQWQWTGAADPRIATWMQNYRTSVQNAWGSAGSGIVFQSSQDGWEDQLARVVVDVDTQNITSLAAGAAIPGRQPTHCQSEIYKTPDRNVFGAHVHPGTASATDQQLDMGSGQVTAPTRFLNQRVWFDPGSSALNADSSARLRKFIISFQAPAGETGTTIDITGRSSSTGERTERGRRRNQQLSEERARAVETFLKTTVVEGRNMENINWRVHGVVGEGSVGATEDDEWCRADIAVAGGEGQNTAAHEFGHMIGLGDEYASTPLRDASGAIVRRDGRAVSRGLISGTGGDVGDASKHNALGEEMGVGGSVYENNANIMSLGSTILPQHYATFMQALHQVSGTTDWQVRA